MTPPVAEQVIRRFAEQRSRAASDRPTTIAKRGRSIGEEEG